MKLDMQLKKLKTELVKALRYAVRFDASAAKTGIRSRRFVAAHAMKAYGMSAQPAVFLTSAPEGGERTSSRPGHRSPGDRPLGAD
jgi:hypothetical protein